jgi:hypothetical protein
MAYEQKPNTGSLFKNHKKESEKHPTHAGSFNIEGTEYWINAWVNETKKGEKYFSLKVKPKEAQAVKKEQPTQEWEDEDSIPF